MLNSFFSPQTPYGPVRLTESGGKAINNGLNIANPFLATGNVNQSAWNGGATVGQTGTSGFMNTAGQMAGQFGPIGAGVQGGLQAIGALTDLFAYNPKVDNLNTYYSSENLPTFDLSEEAASTNNFIDDFRKSANKKVASAAIGGAAAGAAFSPVGAVIGGAAGLIGGLIGKNKAKGEAEEAANKMQQEYNTGISQFNTSTQNYYNRGAAMDKYMANKQQNRNIFGIPPTNPYFYLG